MPLLYRAQSGLTRVEPIPSSASLETIETLHRMLRKRGSVLILCGLQEQPQWLVVQAGLAADLGAGNIAPTLAEAFRRAKEVA